MGYPTSYGAAEKTYYSVRYVAVTHTVFRFRAIYLPTKDQFGGHQ